jgi:hypothetical protein
MKKTFIALFGFVICAAPAAYALSSTQTINNNNESI